MPTVTIAPRDLPYSDTVTVTLTLDELDQITDALEGFAPTSCHAHPDGDHESGPDCNGWTPTQIGHLSDGSDVLVRAWREAIDTLYPVGEVAP